MSAPATYDGLAPDGRAAELRPAETVMNLQRLGSLHPFRLSFMRILLRRIMNEGWTINRERFDLDEYGFGTAIYSIKARYHTYSFIVFADFLEPDKRTDRVIANQWDMTVTLREGFVDDATLAMLRQNVPLQEAGRIDSQSIILSRANKSSRNFEYVVSELAAGRQPGLETIARVGYLYRTTAVYGSGKFGMADWQKVRQTYADFARPFAAEMFACYLIRQFSLDQVDHIARARSPATAVPMDDGIKRYFGIGNATGLGMAPFLINHPQLIDRWLTVRETALARVLKDGACDAGQHEALQCLIRRATQHISEIGTDNEAQNSRNAATIKELIGAAAWLRANPAASWEMLCDEAAASCCFETQEIINSLLMELFPGLVDDLEDSLCVAESLKLRPAESLESLKGIIERHYDWALRIDFDAPESHAVFWYRSCEKSEPRLGQQGTDIGADKAMNISIAYDVRRCYDELCSSVATGGFTTVAEFVLRYPQHRSVVRRIQTLSEAHFGDIRCNLVASDVMPIDLLRCKLSFFGVSKFDPKSRLWVRNTMYQGAPLISDIGAEFKDDWFFPVMPSGNQRGLN